MDDNDFDRFARTFARIVSRRGVLAAAGALAAGFADRSARAAQLVPSTCGAEGQVCTLLMGCCSGFTCATSVINTNYGVCVPGDGGTVTVGTTLISPGSEEAAQEVAALATDATTSTSSTTTTDPEADREARQAEKQARKTDRKNKQETRRSTRKTNRQTQRNERLLRRGPRLGLELIISSEDDTETVRVTNLADSAAVLNRIEPLLSPRDGVSLTTAQFTLAPGDSYLFVSGAGVIDPTDDEYDWLGVPVCSSAVDGDGFLIQASYSTDLENHDYVIYCDGKTGSGKRRRKSNRRQKHRQQQHSRARKKK
jgi:hypothetical protein